ncbi:alpha-acetolactate decarboxylase [Yersinia frederiksenii]|uniref:acetolactate decarboxylase n=1 Tax=Yersinia frederiksenii TaxID=29484 RepID=UPI0005E84ACF|nr:acetolactate decarboxylase [Yersinia frederiksenii]CNC93326.1 alpha-acetolactate decarboxylase [Yersinia frederiksenii]
MPQSITPHCSCTQEVAESFIAYKEKHPECIIYQTSLMSALISGVYEGDITMAELLKHGDFGLGTFNNLDGELVALNSKIYQLRSDGSARAAQPEQKTPFAVMTFFQPTETRNFEHKMNREQLHRVINDVAASDNLFCALRVDGTFSHVETRTVPCQQRPYKPMLEAIAQQPTFKFEHRNGIIIGFRSPNYVQGINVAGYHEHFITDDRNGGGHVLDFQLENGTLTFGTITKLVIDLPQEPDFLQANLSPLNLNNAIRAVES